MKKLYPSWRTVIYAIFAMAFTLLFFFVLFASWSLYRQTKADSQAEGQGELTAIVTETTLRLNSVHGHLTELLLTVENQSNQLLSSGEMEPVLAKYACKDMMDSKLYSNNDIGLLYVYNVSRDIFLLDANVPVALALQVRERLLQESLACNTIGSDTWWVEEIGGIPFFSQAYRIGEFTVGCLSPVSHYNSWLEGNVRQGSVYLLQKDGRVLYQSGEEDELVQRNALSVSQEFPLIEAEAVLVMEGDVLGSIFTYGFLLIFSVVLLFVALLIALAVATRQLVSRPVIALLKVLRAMAEGDFSARVVEEPKSREFLKLRDGFNSMASEIVHLRIEQYDRQLAEKEKELTFLRAQLRPHFYLNAMATIMSMSCQGKNKEIVQYITALSGFMRFVLGHPSRTARLGDELSAIQDYFAMQKLRSAGSIFLFIRCDENLRDRKIPYMMLLTLAENTVKHAMNPYSVLNVMVQCEEVSSPDFQGLCLTVEDNGPGFSAELLEQYSQGKIPAPEKGHIGFHNILEQLKLAFGRDDLLRLSNVPPHGARVELWIPAEERPFADPLFSNL